MQVRDGRAVQHAEGAWARQEVWRCLRPDDLLGLSPPPPSLSLSLSLSLFLSLSLSVSLCLPPPPFSPFGFHGWLHDLRILAFLVIHDSG